MKLVETPKDLSKESEEQAEQNIGCDSSCVGKRPGKAVAKEGLAIEEDDHRAAHANAMAEASEQAEEEGGDHEEMGEIGEGGLYVACLTA